MIRSNDRCTDARMRCPRNFRRSFRAGSRSRSRRRCARPGIGSRGRNSPSSRNVRACCSCPCQAGGSCRPGAGRKPVRLPGPHGPGLIVLLAGAPAADSALADGRPRVYTSSIYSSGRGGDHGRRRNRETVQAWRQRPSGCPGNSGCRARKCVSAGSGAASFWSPWSSMSTRGYWRSCATRMCPFMEEGREQPPMPEEDDLFDR